MLKKDPSKLWFGTVVPGTMSKGGGNGPHHPSQLYAIKKYVKKGSTFLDIGIGAASTYEALEEEKFNLKYTGVDMIPAHVEWAKSQHPEADFRVDDGENLSFEDKSFDVVYSRHVVDHMPSFEKALDEHCRIAKKLVIVILWVPFNDRDEHDIKPIIDGPLDNRITYEQEFTNQYSRSKAKKYLHDKVHEGWKLLEFTEEFTDGKYKGSADHDIIIVLERER